jgi:hypothetical protein
MKKGLQLMKKVLAVIKIKCQDKSERDRDALKERERNYDEFIIT